MQNFPLSSLLGALLFLSTITRPYISTSVSMLGIFQAVPGPTQWLSIKHIIRYLVWTFDLGILLPYRAACNHLEAYSDFDWSRDHSCRQSRSGYVI